MLPYPDLIKELRMEADALPNKFSQNDELFQTLYDAAQAIEKLTAVSGWIKFETRALDEEEKERHPDWSFILCCEVPDDCQDILVSDGRHVWMDVFCNEGEDGCYLESNGNFDDLWWMPLPKPPVTLKETAT